MTEKKKEKTEFEKKQDAIVNVYKEKKEREEKAFWDKVAQEPKKKAMKALAKQVKHEEDEAKKRTVFPNYGR